MPGVASLERSAVSVEKSRLREGGQRLPSNPEGLSPSGPPPAQGPAGDHTPLFCPQASYTPEDAWGGQHLLVFNKCVHVMCVSLPATTPTLTRTCAPPPAPAHTPFSNRAGLNRNAWPSPAEGLSGSPQGARAPLCSLTTAL